MVYKKIHLRSQLALSFLVLAQSMSAVNAADKKILPETTCIDKLIELKLMNPDQSTADSTFAPNRMPSALGASSAIGGEDFHQTKIGDKESFNPIKGVEDFIKNAPAPIDQKNDSTPPPSLQQISNIPQSEQSDSFVLDPSPNLESSANSFANRERLLNSSESIVPHIDFSNFLPNNDFRSGIDPSVAQIYCDGLSQEQIEDRAKAGIPCIKSGRSAIGAGLRTVERGIKNAASILIPDFVSGFFSGLSRAASRSMFPEYGYSAAGFDSQSQFSDQASSSMQTSGSYGQIQFGEARGSRGAGNDRREGSERDFKQSNLLQHLKSLIPQIILDKAKTLFESILRDDEFKRLERLIRERAEQTVLSTPLNERGDLAKEISQTALALGSDLEDFSTERLRLKSKPIKVGSRPKPQPRKASQKRKGPYDFSGEAAILFATPKRAFRPKNWRVRFRTTN